MQYSKIILYFFIFSILFACSATKKVPEQLSEHRSDEQMTELDADYLFGKKEYASAAYLYNKLISDYPDTARYYYKRGKLKTAQGKKSEAISDFTKAILLSDLSQTAYFLDRAKLLIDENEFSAALEDLKISVSIDSYCDKCYNLIGICYGHLYEDDLAIKAFKRALELKPKNNNYRQNLAIEFTRQNKNDSAIFILNEGLEKDSLSVSLLFYRAIAHLESGNQQMAKSDLRICLQTNNKYDTICKTQVQYYTHKNNLSSAEFLLSVILEFSPDNADVLSDMAHIKEYQNNIPEAIDYYSKAIVIKPNETDWLNKLARLLTQEQRYSESIVVYNTLVQFNESITDLYLKRGYAFYKTEKPNLAKKDWQKALELGDEKAKEYLKLYIP